MHRDRRPRLRLVPDAFTVVRPILGGLCAFALVRDDAGTAAWLYLAAYVTDVADGLLARALDVASPAGKRLDGWADLSTSVMITIGVAVAAIADEDWGVLAGMLVLAALGLVKGRWLAAHTVVGKAIGGAYRIAVFVLILALTPASERAAPAIAGAALFAVTYLYEARVTLDEMHTGERPAR